MRAKGQRALTEQITEEADAPRHEEFLEALRVAGLRCLFTDGDLKRPFHRWRAKGYPILAASRLAGKILEMGRERQEQEAVILDLRVESERAGIRLRDLEYWNTKLLAEADGLKEQIEYLRKSGAAREVELLTRIDGLEKELAKAKATLEKPIVRRLCGWFKW